MGGNVQEIKKLEKTFLCECGKIYSSASGLWKHKQKCNQEQKLEKDEPSDKQLIMMLIKENSELKKEQTDIKELILQIVKNGITNTNTTNTTNTTNNIELKKKIKYNFLIGTSYFDLC